MGKDRVFCRPQLAERRFDSFREGSKEGGKNRLFFGVSTRKERRKERRKRKEKKEKRRKKIREKGKKLRKKKKKERKK